MNWIIFADSLVKRNAHRTFAATFEKRVKKVTFASIFSTFTNDLFSVLFEKLNLKE